MSEINRSVQPLEFTVRFDFDVACRRAKHQFPDQKRETIDTDFDITITVNGEAQKLGGGYISSLITEEDVEAWARRARTHIEEHFAGVLRQAAISMVREAQWHAPKTPLDFRFDAKNFAKREGAEVEAAIKARLGVRRTWQRTVAG